MRRIYRPSARTRKPSAMAAYCHGRDQPGHRDATATSQRSRHVPTDRPERRSSAVDMQASQRCLTEAERGPGPRKGRPDPAVVVEVADSRGGRYPSSPAPGLLRVRRRLLAFMPATNWVVVFRLCMSRCKRRCVVRGLQPSALAMPASVCLAARRARSVSVSGSSVRSGSPSPITFASGTARTHSASNNGRGRRRLRRS